MKRLFLGSLAAALALFAFGAAFWICPIPYAYVEKASVSDQELGQTLRSQLPNDGVYLVPSINNDPATLKSLYQQGPVVTIHYHKDGVEPMAPGILITGFFHGWVTTFLLAGMLHLTALPRFGQRLLLITLAGAAAANYMVLSAGIYWFQPWPWLILNASFDAAAFLVTGLVLAAIVKPVKARPATVSAPQPV